MRMRVRQEDLPPAEKPNLPEQTSCSATSAPLPTCFPYRWVVLCKQLLYQPSAGVFFALDEGDEPLHVCSGAELFTRREIDLATI